MLRLWRFHQFFGPIITPHKFTSSTNTQCTLESTSLHEGIFSRFFLRLFNLNFGNPFYITLKLSFIFVLINYSFRTNIF
ncbi:hypothetical protein VIGAN_04204900 [Vigna angularis var. angularis]|uniref:Uncharacterized protein n=1 Tax=Vigna angularis var. angularis TaxID=157739 RepID=A0A0S3RVQ2_PHAAN|nr:hypothetical protein VIGAN_04204900 [Vigna angularis var. angularis]